MDIKSVIKEHGFTSVQVAEKLGINKSSFSQNINGNPTIGTLRSIANVIGCKVGDFFKDEMEETESRAVPTLVCPHCGKEIKVTLE